MLYPTTINPDPTIDDVYVIPSGAQHCFPFVLDGGDAKAILVVHMAGTANQDHSLRVWVSRAPGDSPAQPEPHATAFWHPNRNDQEIITVFDEDMPREAMRLPLGLPPGNYTINVLNLVNRENAYSFRLTDLA